MSDMTHRKWLVNTPPVLWRCWLDGRFQPGVHAASSGFCTSPRKENGNCLAVGLCMAGSTVIVALHAVWLDGVAFVHFAPPPRGLCVVLYRLAANFVTFLELWKLPMHSGLTRSAVSKFQHLTYIFHRYGMEPRSALSVKFKMSAKAQLAVCGKSWPHLKAFSAGHGRHGDHWNRHNLA